MITPLVEVRGLKKHFEVRRGLLRRTAGKVLAVDSVDLDVIAGETLGLVGESGCGKSTLARLLLRLLEPTAGQIRFNGRNLLELSGADMKVVRRDMQLIFQDSQGSLDPRMTVRQIVGEGPAVHRIGSRAMRDKAVRDVLERVGLRPEGADRYPHEFSGGQRQRIGIARALVMRPKLVVADEPVSALDVSIQSQILNLLVELKREFKLTYVFVAHNLAAVGYISDRIAVMHLGKVVELASTAALFSEPLHPYSKALLSAIPDLALTNRGRRIVLKGELPSPMNPPSGCRFRTRCPIAREICAEKEPELDLKAPNHLVACHFVEARVPIQARADD